MPLPFFELGREVESGLVAREERLGAPVVRLEAKVVEGGVVETGVDGEVPWAWIPGEVDGAGAEIGGVELIK